MLCTRKKDAWWGYGGMRHKGKELDCLTRLGVACACSVARVIMTYLTLPLIVLHLKVAGYRMEMSLEAKYLNTSR